MLLGSTFADQVLAKKCPLFTVASGILLTISLERFHNWANVKKEKTFRIPSFPSLLVRSNRINFLSLFIVVSSFLHPHSTTTFGTSFWDDRTRLDWFPRETLIREFLIYLQIYRGIYLPSFKI